MLQGRSNIIHTRTIRAGLVCAFLFSIGRSFDASAEIGDQKYFFGITDEDDCYTYPWIQHTDRHYTHGIKFSFMDGYTPATNAPSFLKKILGWGTRPEASSIGGVLGQNMYTPENILDPSPIPNDRPYTGWFYAGPVYQRQGELAPNLAVMDSFEADLGVVGHDSLAGTTMKMFHRAFFPDDVPQGWHNQIKNEPGLVLKYERLWRWSPTAGTAKYLDVIPHAGFDLGNVFTFGNAGATGRIGFDLPPDFGEATIDSPGSASSGFTAHSNWISLYVFGGVDGRAVGQNITLDGSWFQSDPSVSRNIFVADLSYGFALQFHPRFRFPQIEMAFTHIDRTKEFRGQNQHDIFGSLTLKLNFSFP